MSDVKTVFMSVFGLLVLYSALNVWYGFKVEKRFKKIEKHLGFNKKDR